MRLTAIVAALVLCFLPCAHAEETVIPPQWEVPEYVTHLLEIAGKEVGYTEGAHGYSKYGEWAGDPYAQWCAEFLCWCVDQVDQQYGTELLRKVYPMYSGSNTGKNWYVEQGRYIVRWGNLENWGYQWLEGEDTFLSTGDYIPQPGDWVFFTWDSGTDTDHVALVEYCTQDEQGNIRIHVIEGNAPSSVARNVYDLTYTRILGYGTVHPAARTTMRSGCRGESVRALQEDLAYIGFYHGHADGVYGAATVQAVKDFQRSRKLKENGIANIETQTALADAVAYAIEIDPATWQVVEDEE